MALVDISGENIMTIDEAIRYERDGPESIEEPIDERPEKQREKLENVKYLAEKLLISIVCIVAIVVIIKVII